MKEAKKPIGGCHGKAHQEGRGPRCFSAKRKTEVILRLLRGEDLDALSRELGGTAAQISGWREVAIELAEMRPLVTSRAPEFAEITVPVSTYVTINVRSNIHPEASQAHGRAPHCVRTGTYRALYAPNRAISPFEAERAAMSPEVARGTSE